MSWDYSELSHQAKQLGGPEKFVKNLESFNYNKGLRDGKKEQTIVFLAIAGVAGGGYVLFKKIRDHIKKTKEPQISAAQADESRNQLIQTIKDAEKNKVILEEEVDENGKMCQMWYRI